MVVVIFDCHMSTGIFGTFCQWITLFVQFENCFSTFPLKVLSRCKPLCQHVCKQVKKFLAFKAYTRPHYLSLAFTEEKRISDDKPIHEADIEDLQMLDPLRRAFDLAEEAENFNTNFTGMSNFRKHYASIQDDLEMFAHDLLSQCSNMEEVKTILMHNPEDDDDDDDDLEEKNWEKALLEGRKDFVAHPFFQQYFWTMMAGH